jgi:hypothetical protein
MACAFGSCQSWPRRHKADGGQVPVAVSLGPAGIKPTEAKCR